MFIKIHFCFSNARKVYFLRYVLKSLGEAVYSRILFKSMDVDQFLSAVFPSKKDENIATPR